MKNYTMNNGHVLTAKDDKEFVEQLNALSWFNHKNTIWEYMFSTAILCEKQKECEIRSRNVSEFVEDLKENGFIIDIKNVDN